MLCFHSLFFGLSQSLAVIGSQLPFLQGVPAVYLQIAPYLLTILVLAAFFGKAVAPRQMVSTISSLNKQKTSVSKLACYFWILDGLGLTPKEQRFSVLFRIRDIILVTND